MAGIDEIRAERLKKRARAIELGMHPYAAYTSHEGDSIRDFLEDFNGRVERTERITVAGRIFSIREHGGVLFFDLYDGTSSIQGYLKKDDAAEAFNSFIEVADRGDFVEIAGTAAITKRGERSVLIERWTLLTKNLQPIPEEWYGLKDDDERYRRRYLDLLLRDDARALFEKKALFWQTMRTFLHERKFIEVETPTLETTTGGAEARPFKTHHNDFDIDVYLRISVGELWQKRLMAAGFPRTFEIGRVYRNEGTSPEHLQEFTNMELYAAYMNFADGKKLVRNLYIELAQKVFGTTTFDRKGFTFDLADEWPDIDYVDTIRQATGVDVLESPDQELEVALAKLGVTYDGKNRERMTDALWKYCRKSIGGPAFLVNHPKVVAPLSKVREDDDRKTYTAQVIIAGTEMGRMHGELNDPDDQRMRFEVQQKLIETGDDEAMMPDWDYVEMLEYGMPPTFGFGGGERLFSTLAGVTIRESQLFPLMRPKNAATAKDTKVAVAIINTKGLAGWQVLNTVAHLSAELGVRGGKQLLKQETIVTADQVPIPLNIKHAILIKTASSSNELKNVLTEARTRGMHTAAFTREMLETTNDKKVIDATAKKLFDEIDMLGVLVFGEKQKIDEITKGFNLHS